MTFHPEAALLNVCLLCMLTVPHEFAHAWIATLLGDDTPEREGRVTLYPPAHIDLMGTVILPAITSLLGGGIIGWGKPVNTNPSKLRWGLNGLVLVAMAGPASNIILAVIFGGLARLFGNIEPQISELCVSAASLSVYLALFNLLPVPPLDGSKLLLAARISPGIYMELARFGFILLLVAMSATSLGYYISFYSRSITVGILRLFYW